MPAGVSAFTPIANISISSPTTSVTFGSITQIYKDLLIVSNINCASAGGFYLRFNSPTPDNYFFCRLGMNISQTVNQTGTVSNIGIGFSNPMNNFEFNITHNVLSYSATNTEKLTLHRGNAVNGVSTGCDMQTTRWANTSAITSLTIFTDQAMQNGSTIAIYGISS
jgi:hypothetical protein